MNFKDPEIWKNYDPDNQSHVRIKAIMSFIPDDVHSILDAGCGNGVITNSLIGKYDITGIDSSTEALKYLKCPSVKASITQIPYANESFDLAMCNEVLEHLDSSSLLEAINELKRISRKYILISVPHREQLANLLYRCAKCGYAEHAYGHLQSFSLDALQQLLATEYVYQKHLIFGPSTRDFMPCLLNLKQQRFKQWFNPYPGCRCSRCGSESFINQSSIFTKAINGINKVLIRKRPFWLMVLYARKQDH